MPFKYLSMMDRLYANSICSQVHFFEGTPCWDWIGQFGTGGRSIGRYPQITVRVNGKHKVLRAHRVSYETFKDEVLGDREVDHKCARRCCIAPEHLEAVSSKENIRRRDARRRA